jgi:hypothetical protein
MSKLEWDKTGERLFETGISKVALYPQDSKGAYPVGVAWNGITAITENKEGAESTVLYADGIKYAILRSAETLGLTIEAYTYPDEWASCDGSAEVADGVFIGQQKRKSFGLCYRTEIGNDTNTEEDDGYKLHLVYSCTASPTDVEYDTVNDSPDAATMSWDVETTPVNVTGYKPTALITIDSTKVDKTQLQALEDKLYGTESATPMLPLPDDVLAIFKKAEA